MEEIYFNKWFMLKLLIKKSGGGELNCFVYLNVVFFLYSLFYSLKGWKVFLFYEIFFFLS